jgi:protein-S-isoprenylcysteine O-methyltransferase Ste14
VATPYLQQSHLAAVVLSVSVGAFALGEFSQVLRLRIGARVADLSGEVLFRVLFFGAILVLPLCSSVVPEAVIPGGAVPFLVGAVVGWLGLLLRWWCFITLGRYFTVVLKTSSNQEIVDRGPYRVLRHPSYTGLLLALVGGGLMLGNWAGAVASFALAIAAVLYRIRIEERALNTTVGDAYRLFSKTRARLVPFVW